MDSGAAPSVAVSPPVADPRSPQRRAAPDLGPIHDLSPSPTVRVMAGWKHLPERVLTALRERPLVLSPLDGA